MNPLFDSLFLSFFCGFRPVKVGFQKEEDALDIDYSEPSVNGWWNDGGNKKTDGINRQLLHFFLLHSLIQKVYIRTRLTRSIPPRGL